MRELRLEYTQHLLDLSDNQYYYEKNPINQLQYSSPDPDYYGTPTSVGPNAKLDMFKNFDLDKPFDLHLDLLSSENPPLCRITQEGKDPIITTDFYLTNVEPREGILPTLPTNNETASSTTAAAASNFTPEIPPDPVQPGEITSIQYTPQALVLDLRGQNVTSTLDLRDAFHQLCLCPTEDDQQGESSPNSRRKSQKTKKST